MATSGLVKTALEKKRLAGERTGQVPFGFSLADDGKKLIPNTDEQEVLEMIKQWRHEGKTIRGIADELTSRGVPTKTGKTRWHPTAVHRVASNTKWSHATIQRIINREVKR